MAGYKIKLPFDADYIATQVCDNHKIWYNFTSYNYNTLGR